MTHTITPSTVFPGQWEACIFTPKGIVHGSFGSLERAAEFVRRVCEDLASDDCGRATGSSLRITN